MAQSANGKQSMIYRAEFIASDDDNPAAQAHDQIEDSEITCDWDQHSTGSFYEQDLTTAGDIPDVFKQGFHSDDAMVFSGGHEWGDRFREVKGVDLAQCQLVPLNRAKQTDVCTRTRTEWFQGQRMGAFLAQVMQEQ